MENPDKTLFIDFFKNEIGKKYVDQAINGTEFIVIDLDEMNVWNHQHTLTVINNAVKYGIKFIEQALEHVVKETKTVGDIPDFDVGFKGKIIPYVKIHDLASQNIGKLIRVKGLVSRIHFIKPMAVKVVFECQNCAIHGEAQHETIKQKIPFILTSPSKTCSVCKERVNYNVVEELSEYIDSQEFSLQEGHEDSSGRTPQLIQMIVTKKHLINKIYCGNSIEVTGVIRLMPTYRFKSKSRFYIPYVEVYDIINDTKAPEDMEISQEEEAEIIALSQEENIYEKLIFNVAPSISGLEKCKEASLLSMFGGVTKKRKDITIRGNIHCLFVGDAGVAKSQLLTSIAGLAPKAYLSVGEGSSAAGLTAALNRDETTGDWVIDAGALVLSDQGVCCMDEVDKMNENDRKRIHEAMEQQTITIWKAGRHAVLRARTSVIAAANPTLGKYNPDKTVFQNLKFPPTLFSRFDLIFVLIDKPVVANDKSIVRHMLEANSKEFGTVDRETFKKYIAYAKSINPVLNSEAIESLENFFLNIRERMVSESKEDSVSITYRQLDGLVRLTEAHARILLKNKADKSDAEAAIRIFNEYLKDINFDVLTHVTNVPKTVREIEPILEELLINLQRQVCYSDGVPYHIWLEEATEKGVNKEKAKEVILSMYNSGHITKSRENSEETYYRSACRN